MRHCEINKRINAISSDCTFMVRLFSCYLINACPESAVTSCRGRHAGVLVVSTRRELFCSIQIAAVLPVASCTSTVKCTVVPKTVCQWSYCMLNVYSYSTCTSTSFEYDPRRCVRAEAPFPLKKGSLINEFRVSQPISILPCIESAYSQSVSSLFYQTTIRVRSISECE